MKKELKKLVKKASQFKVKGYDGEGCIIIQRNLGNDVMPTKKKGFSFLGMNFGC